MSTLTHKDGPTKISSHKIKQKKEETQLSKQELQRMKGKKARRNRGKKRSKNLGFSYLPVIHKIPPKDTALYASLRR